MRGGSMRAKGRCQGRFVALSGLRKIPGPPGSPYPIMIVDGNGLPVFHVSEWYRRKKAYDRGRTPDTYLDMLLPLVGFQLRHHYAWNAPPDVLRAQMVEFLREDAQCQVGPAGEREGYLVETTGTTPLSKSSLGVFLAAVTSLYDVLVDTGYYPYPNPMCSERLAALKREHLRQVQNAGAPDEAGIRSESWQETQRAYPLAFFRQKRGKVWEPGVVMEPDEVQQRVYQAIDFMIDHASFLRDKLILLLLRQTGARLSEIVEMTVGGYRHAQHPQRALVKNKGSHGREEKKVYFTPIIEEQLQKYLRTERATHDPQGRQRLEDLEDQDPLFLTEAGTPYSRDAFYYHWYKLFEPAQARRKKKERVDFSPHDLRHLRVTRAITKIRQRAKGDKQLERDLIEGFRQIMGWQSAETMETYIHVLNKRQALLEVILDDDEGEQAPHNTQSYAVQEAPQQQLTKEKANSPARTSYEEDDFSWYEEA
jgi:integrase